MAHRTRVDHLTHPAPPGWTAGHTALRAMWKQAQIVLPAQLPSLYLPQVTEAGGPGQPTMKTQTDTPFCGLPAPLRDTAGQGEAGGSAVGRRAFRADPKGLVAGSLAGSRGLPHLSGPSGLASPLPGHPQPWVAFLPPWHGPHVGAVPREQQEVPPGLCEGCANAAKGSYIRWDSGRCQEAGLVVLVGGLA